MREHRYQFIIGNTKIPLFFAPSQNPNQFVIRKKKAWNRTQTIGGYTYEHWGKEPAIMKVRMLIRKDDFIGNFFGRTSVLDLKDPLITIELKMLNMLYELDRRKLVALYKNNTDTANMGAKGDAVSAKKGAVSSLKEKTSQSFGNSVTSKTATASQKVSGKFGQYTEKATKSISNFWNGLSDTIIYYKDTIYSGFFDSMEIPEDAQTPYHYVIDFDFIVLQTTGDVILENLANKPVGRNVLGTLGIATSALTAAEATAEIAQNVGTLVSDNIKGILKIF